MNSIYGGRERLKMSTSIWVSGSCFSLLNFFIRNYIHTCSGEFSDISNLPLFATCHYDCRDMPYSNALSIQWFLCLGSVCQYAVQILGGGSQRVKPHPSHSGRGIGSSCRRHKGWLASIVSFKVIIFLSIGLYRIGSVRF